MADDRKNDLLKRSLKVISLSVIPLLFLFVGLALYSVQPLSFATITDPSYNFLLNGLNFAQIKIFSGNYHHPAIPLQFLCGVIIKITYFFAGQHPDIVTDVFQRPEFYINVINSSILFLIAIQFFFIGYFIFRISNILLFGVLLQAILFINYTSFYQLTVLVPERLFFSLTAFLIVLLIWYIYNGKITRNFVILLGVTIGFCVMEKFSILPLVLLPVFVLKNKKQVFTYLLSFSITFFILFIPIISHLKRMRSFFTAMFSHSGLYGGGSDRLIDFSTIIPNLHTLFTDMRIPMYSLVILLLFIPLAFILKKSKKDMLPRIRRIMIGIAVVELIILLMVLKHFKPHYFTAAASFSVFNIYLCIEYLRQRFDRNKKLPSILVLAVIFIPFINYPTFKERIRNIDRKLYVEESVRQINSYYSHTPKFIIPRYYGSPFVEFSFLSGMFYSYNIGQYGKILVNMYPDSYLYTTDWGSFDLSYKGVNTKETILKYDRFIISYFKEDTSLFNSFMNELDSLQKKYSVKRTFYDDREGYVISEIRFADKKELKDPVVTYESDMETGDSLVSDILSTDVARSGSHSIKINSGSKLFTLSDLHPGDRVRACIWGYNISEKSRVELTGADEKPLSSGNQITENDYMWNKMELDFILPDDFIQKELFLSIKNNEGSARYFDDLEILVFR